MAKVNFLRGLFSDYSNLATKDTGTLYITGATADSFDSIYLGEHLLGSSSLGKLPFDAVSYNATYNNSSQPYTKQNLSEATTLLEVIAVLENRLDSATGADNAVLSIGGLTGAIKIENANPDDFSSLGNGQVYVDVDNGAKSLFFATKINTAGLFGTTQIDKLEVEYESDGVTPIFGDDGMVVTKSTTFVDDRHGLLQIVEDTNTSSNSIHLAKLRLRMCNPEQKEETNPYSYAYDGLVLMSDVKKYVERLLTTHKTETNAHDLVSIGSVDPITGQSMYNTITSTTGPWSFTHKYFEYESIAEGLRDATNAQELALALFDTITASLSANQQYTLQKIETVTIEWGEIA